MPATPESRIGPYEILAPIGAGGMGEVWKARDTRLDRIVAIKRLKGEHNARFDQESRAIAALNHPHICVLYDVGPDYLVMEYLEGLPLKGPLPIEEALTIATQIAGAVEAAHAKGILHRDLKPGNVMITASGAKLLDFGLARIMTASDADALTTVCGTIAGTAAYMSPEQAQGRALDARSDIFSFGALLYEMLTGSQAFAGESMLEILNAVVRTDPAPLQSPAADIVTRCMAKQTAQRFQSMTDVRKALEQVSTKPAASQPSIAVLPFANMSVDKDQEYFSDGLAEEIINALAQLPGLKVTARTSAFAFRGKEQDIRKIAEVLDVRTVLEGSVRRSGNRIRVTAQLINAADGYHLWSQRYDREMEDVFAVQDDIAAAITSALQVKLGAAPERYRPNPAAYEAYLKGRHYLSSFTPSGMERAREYLEQAIALDSNFALAHSDLGSYWFAKTNLGWTPILETMPKIRAALRRALELEPSLPEAHAMLGILAAFHDYDWTGAEQEFRQAMAIEPVPVAVRIQYGRYLVFSGRVQEPLRQFRIATEQDPLNVLVRYWLGAVLVRSGRGEEGLAELKRAVETIPHFALDHVMALGYFSNGRLSEALAAAENANKTAPPDDKIQFGLLAGLLRITGGDSERVAALLRRLDGRVYGTPIALAIFHLICGDLDQAADWVAKSAEERYVGTLFFINGTRLGDALRTSERWPALAKMMNLPEAE
jgi:eukaryotic-like serine/threonine-protein kinase